MGLESHAPMPFLDKATSSIIPSLCQEGMDDALLHHCLLTRQNVMFIQGFGGEKEGKQAEVGTIQVPEYVCGATCKQAQPQAGQQKCPHTSCLQSPDKGTVFNFSLGQRMVALDAPENNMVSSPSCSVNVLPSCSRSHLHCEDESSAVEGIFPVQGPIQG